MPSPNSAAGSAALNYQLTAYAQGLWNDQKETLALAERLAPTTPVPGTNGQFKKFEDKNSFLPPSTARALGGEPTLIKFSATDDTYNTKPQALEVRVDKEEDNAAGGDGANLASQLLDQGKMAALVSQKALAHANDVVTFVLANVSATADRGNFSNADIDPIDQINEMLLNLATDCGSKANVKITMDLGVWNTLRSHPKVKARAVFGAGANLAAITLEQLNAALLFPVDIMTALVVKDTAALGQTASKSRLLSGVLLAHYSVPNPTIYDPSAFKSFTVGQAGPIAGVRTYQAPNGLWRGHIADWSRDIKKTSSLSIRRLTVT